MKTSTLKKLSYWAAMFCFVVAGAFNGVAIMDAIRGQWPTATLYWVMAGFNVYNAIHNLSRYWAIEAEEALFGYDLAVSEIRKRREAEDAAAARSRPY